MVIEARLDRRVVLIGGAVVLSAAATAGVLRLRHRALPREPGLVGSWAFDATAGDIVIDSSGLGNDGTIFPAGTPDDKWGSGEFAGSLSLTGRDHNHVTIPPTDTLNGLTTQLTVAAHVYPRTGWQPGSPGDGFVSIVQRQWRDVIHPDLFYLGFGVEEGVQYYKWHLGLVGSEPSLYKLPPGAGGIATGRWVHLAGTYDGATGAMVLYVDGAEIGRLSVPGAIRLDSGSFGRPLIIGGELNGESLTETSGEFDGYVDEVRLYERALSADEINSLATETKSRRENAAAG